jgi:hypothetical protein
MIIDYTWTDALWAAIGCMWFWVIGYGMGFRAATREADRMNLARGERS